MVDHGSISPSAFGEEVEKRLLVFIHFTVGVNMGLEPSPLFCRHLFRGA